MTMKVLMADPPYEEISKFLSYDPESGKIIWAISPSTKIKPYQLAGSKKDTGYISVYWRGKNYPAHRLAWLLYYKEPCLSFIDHIDGNKENNSIINLRAASKSENNYHKRFESNLPRGVSWKPSHGKWRARIKKDNKEIFIGYFDDVKLASEAYKKKARELYPNFFREDFC